MPEAMVIIKGRFSGARFLLALAVLAGTGAMGLLVAWAGMATVMAAALLMVGFPYAAYLLASNLRHSFERIVLGPDGFRRGSVSLPWAGFRGARKETREYRNRLGMAFPVTRLLLDRGDGKTLVLDRRWFGAARFGLLEETIGRHLTIQEDFQVVPPPK